MRPRPEIVLLATLLAAGAAGAESSRDGLPTGGLLDAGKFGSRKEPITVTSDTLDYDYKNNVVVYRGDVLAVQGDVKVKSDRLTITLETSGKAKDDKDPAAPAPTSANPSPIPDPSEKGAQRLKEVIAEGHVRIDSGTRWATGGKAVFDQKHRTLVLTDQPKLHEGSNEVGGDRVIVYLDEDRSVVEGGRQRVKAVLYPGTENGLAPAEGKRRKPGDAPKAAGGEPSGGEAPVAEGDTRRPTSGATGP
ncbi:MAG TPA: LptA/OstA family protein [Candidatus Binatia bacterium]|nr:LptA/OstA family protein [Candidatus Binatia bacterium]